MSFTTNGAVAHEQSFPLRCDLTEIPDSCIEETGNKQVGKFKKFNVKVIIEVREQVHFSIKADGNDLVSLKIDL